MANKLNQVKYLNYTRSLFDRFESGPIKTGKYKTLKKVKADFGPILSLAIQFVTVRLGVVHYFGDLDRF